MMPPLFALLEHASQNTRSIRHDAIDAHLQEPVHLSGVIHGPHVDLHAAVVCPFEKTGGEHRYTFVPQGNLQTAEVGPCTWRRDPATDGA